MRCFALLAMVALAITCGPSPDAKLPGYATPTGGANTSATGGTTDTGGTTTVGAGGITGAGGSKIVGTGGKTGAGGAVASGGITGTGGRAGADGGPGGVTGSGGRRDAGGSTVGNGGATKDDAGRGGNAGGFGTGGSAMGGTTGKNDAAISPSDSAGNCLTRLIANNYVCGSAPPCSACKDNSTSKAVECQAVLDCIEASYPCSGNCTTECFNKNGGNGPVQTCVTALQTAACGASGCGITSPPNGGG
jgi:hypothetical protein